MTTVSWLLWHIIRKTIHILYFLCQLISNCHISNAFALKFIKPPVLHNKHKGIIILCFSGRVCQEKKLSKSFNFTFHYIHDVLTLSNSRFNDIYIWHLSQWTWDKYSPKKKMKSKNATLSEQIQFIFDREMIETKVKLMTLRHKFSLIYWS